MKWFFPILLALIPSFLSAQFTFPWTRLTETDSITYLPTNNARAIVAINQTVHVVFTDRRDGAAEVFYKRSLDGGTTWEADRRLTTDDNIFSGRATIAAWNNEVHIVWMDRRDNNNELYYSRSINNGNSWSTPTRLTNNGATSEYPSLVVDFQSLHLVWNDARHGENEIYYKRSTNGGLSWSADIRLTNSDGEAYKPCVAVVDSVVHVMWEDGRNGASEIFYKYAEDNGTSWTDDLKISNSTGDCYSPFVSANGKVVFVTWDDPRTGNSEIFSRRSIDGGHTWGGELNQSFSNNISYDATHAFYGTYMFMIYNDGTVNDPDLHAKYSTDAGFTWALVPNFNLKFSRQEQPKVAIDGKTVHVIYEDDLDGNFEIYHTYNLSANPFPHQHKSVWSHSINSSQADAAYSMTTDETGNVYVAGTFNGTVDFDPGMGEYTLTAAGTKDAFVSKMNRDGSLVWAKQIGGPETDIGYEVALDDEGNIIVAGSFHTIVDFDPGPEVFNMGAISQEDVFVLKLNNNGEFIWAKKLGGGGRDEPQSIAINSTGQVLVTGYFAETADFDPGPNTHELASLGEEDIFIASLDGNGELAWAHAIGGTDFDAGRAITVDKLDQITITGSFRNTADFDPGPAQLQLTSDGESDIFLMKLNMNGTLAWAYPFGDIGEDEGEAISTDDAGNIYTTGHFSGAVDFDINGSELVMSNGPSSMYVVAFLPDGDAFWSEGYRSNFGEINSGTAITCDDGYVYVAGTFSGQADFQPGHQVTYLSSSGGTDIVIQKMNAQNGNVEWLNQFGGNSPDIAFSVVAMPYGKIGVAGSFYSVADFSPGIDQQRFVSAGITDGFITVFRDCEPTYGNASVTVCSEYVFNAQYVFDESGTYIVLIESASGCDSIITLELTILEAAEMTVIVAACDTYTTPGGTHTWTESGVYTVELTASNGCDSIIIYELTILESTHVLIEEIACDQYTDPGGNTYTESGVYINMFVNAAGCDSVTTIKLTIHHSAISDTTIQACNTYTTPDGAHTWTKTGTYEYVAQTAAGCDSAVTIQLFIQAWDISVTTSGNTLHAVNQFANFQWVDCGNDYAHIFGANISTYTPQVSGSYAVIIGAGDCYDTTACYTITIVGTSDPGPLQTARIYPNPVKDRVYIDVPATINHYDVMIADVYGRNIERLPFDKIQEGYINLDLPPGFYVLTLISGDFRKSFRVVKI